MMEKHFHPLLGLTEGKAAEHAEQLDQQELLRAMEGALKKLRLSVSALQLDNEQLRACATLTPGEPAPAPATSQ
jgi:hypothetical protein